MDDEYFSKILASDEEAELAAQEEETEAMTLQKRMASRLDEDDFYAFEQVGFNREQFFLYQSDDIPSFVILLPLIFVFRAEIEIRTSKKCIQINIFLIKIP